MGIYFQGRMAEMLRAVSGSQVVDNKARLGQGKFDDAVTDNMDVVTDDTQHNTFALIIACNHCLTSGASRSGFDSEPLISLRFDRATIKFTGVAGNRKVVEMYQMSGDHVAGQAGFEILFQCLFR